jgi:hypothetical protein
MKKIMFSDKFCLTQAVLSGRKTMTRRKFTLTLDKNVDGELIRVYPSKVFFDNGKWLFDYEGRIYNLPKENYPRYGVGEVVAIAQSYNDIGKLEYDKFGKGVAGNSNKMFVRANLMPHHIRITDVKIERLQDISVDDILSEGVWQFYDNKNLFYVSKNIGYAPDVAFLSAREAFWYLIDNISGKGTWESNPWVVAYSFELVD